MGITSILHIIFRSANKEATLNRQSSEESTRGPPPPSVRDTLRYYAHTKVRDQVCMDQLQAPPWDEVYCRMGKLAHPITHQPKPRSLNNPPIHLLKEARTQAPIRQGELQLQSGIPSTKPTPTGRPTRPHCSNPHGMFSLCLLTAGSRSNKQEACFPFHFTGCHHVSATSHTTPSPSPFREVIVILLPGSPKPK